MSLSLYSRTSTGHEPRRMMLVLPSLMPNAATTEWRVEFSQGIEIFIGKYPRLSAFDDGQAGFLNYCESLA